MANETTNVLAVVRSLLLADANIVSHVGNRIRTAHIYDAESLPLEYPLIIVAPLGGVSRQNRHLMETTVEVFVYSKNSITEALDIYELVYNVMQSSRLNRTGIATKGLMRETERPREGYHDGLVAWYTRTTYNIISAG